MQNETLEKIVAVFEAHSAIKLAYLFGSQATGNAGPMSDFDFAFFVDGIEKNEIFDLRLKLMAEIGMILKTDKIDLLCLNLIESPELKYAIIKEGKILLEKEPFRVILEPKILNEYFDFHDLLKKYNLTRI